MAPNAKLSNPFAHCQEYCHKYVTTCLPGRMTSDMADMGGDTTAVVESQLPAVLLIDSPGVNKFTWSVFFFLGMSMVFDGYDYMVVP
jgi:hypothetical protein